MARQKTVDFLDNVYLTVSRECTNERPKYTALSGPVCMLLQSLAPLVCRKLLSLETSVHAMIGAELC